MGFAVELQNEWSGWIKGGFYSDVFDPLIPYGSEVVKAQGIPGFINDLVKALFHFHVLCGINLAFENGKLHPLAVVETNLGHATQSLCAPLA